MDMITRTNKEISPGSKDSLGATLSDKGVNFALFSQNATEVFLVLFDDPSGEQTDFIKMENKTDNIWHVFVKGVKAGQLYGYKVNGEYNPAEGKRFNPYKLLLDPYAKAITGKFENQDNLIFAYDLNALEKDLSLDNRDNSQIVPKSIVVDDNFDWQQDSPPNVPMDELVIYEAHIKGFTAHASSKVKHPGTYLGFIEKIAYLKELGITAVELMPVHEFFIRNELTEKGLTDYWGYNTIGFFAPESSFGTKSKLGCQVEEFKTLVRELHKSGIEVILDVVYNHTGEGNELGPTLCFKGIDNSTYYALAENPNKSEESYRYYLNDTGCGNTFNIESPVAMRLVLDSLRYWAQIMHVDGFRFDLASILARVKGEFSEQSKFFEAVSADPILSKVKMIAEPWDLKTYQVGNFPKAWSEWNGKFRDTARRFIKGDDGQAGEMAKRLTGSADLYQEDGRKPYNSINFITCHDGFTLNDLYSYNSKHNQANLEDNKDGANDNHSWNCGVEGDTSDKNIIEFRKQMIKNALACLLFSSGTPMILYGDEIMRTQKGNNNGYCQDNELTWFNWDSVDHNSEIFEFCRKAIEFRKKYAILRCRRFFAGEDASGDNIPDIQWFDKQLEAPDLDQSKERAVYYQLDGNESLAAPGNYYLFLAYNMNNQGNDVLLPKHKDIRWFRLIDTAKPKDEDFLVAKKEELNPSLEIYQCNAYSVTIFWGERQ
ncbi:MAG: glycogen debranching protein GlgX [Candidatus Omnitrophica bacterium]|nr:glycogen debranching protein GlgX [Candidatus Omnitrophota bacterium]